MSWKARGVEITAMQQNNEKRMKINESVSIMGRTFSVPVCLDLGSVIYTEFHEVNTHYHPQVPIHLLEYTSN